MTTTQVLNVRCADWRCADWRCADWRCAAGNWRLGILFAVVLVSAMAARGEDQVTRPTPPPFYRDKLDLLHWLDDRGQRQPVRTIDDWQKRRGHILRNFELATGSLPGPDRKVPLDVRVTEVVQLEKYERRKLTFATEHNDRVPAYLLIPKEIKVAPLRDSNFPVKGLTDAQQALAPLYKLHTAEDRLTFDFPDAEHTFPPASRETTYAWLDRWLKPNEARPSATGK